MREILFRGKTKNELPSYWVYGSLTDVGHKWFIDDYRVNARVITETIGQYTGLTDKNGTKIFEGDIIKYYQDKKQINYGVIEYRNYYFGVKPITNSLSVLLDIAIKWHNAEVVGNIYDNTELLKEVASEKMEENLKLELKHNQLFDQKEFEVNKIKAKGYEVVNVEFNVSRGVEIYYFRLKKAHRGEQF